MIHFFIVFDKCATPFWETKAAAAEWVILEENELFEKRHQNNFQVGLAILDSQYNQFARQFEQFFCNYNEGYNWVIKSHNYPA